jgi:hypothetical protein
MPGRDESEREGAPLEAAFWSPLKVGLPMKGSIMIEAAAISTRKAEWPNQVIFMLSLPLGRLISFAG